MLGHGDPQSGPPHDHHSHTHGAVDPSILTTQRGIWAVKWSLLVLVATAVFQMVIVLLSGSVALLADTIHNFGDAATAIPLWIAFTLARWKPNDRFPYGYGRVEDLAGVAIVLTILLSAIVAGYESIDRLSHPQPGRVFVGGAYCIGNWLYWQRGSGDLAHQRWQRDRERRAHCRWLSRARGRFDQFGCARWCNGCLAGLSLS